MSRIKIPLPEKFLFTTEIQVRITDINYGGHLGNDSLLALIHEARVKFLKSMDFSELDAGGAGLIMSDAAIVFKSEVFYGTMVKFEIGLADPGPMGCDFVYLLTDSEYGKELARAKTGIVFFDYQKHKPVRMPEKFKQITGFE
jgi:acyl-CoA thioesterase FadM